MHFLKRPLRHQAAVLVILPRRDERHPASPAAPHFLVQIYLETFQNLHFSYGMAMSLVITLVALLMSLVFVLRVYRNTRFD